MRGALAAETEIRRVAVLVYKILSQEGIARRLLLDIEIANEVDALVGADPDGKAAELLRWVRDDAAQAVRYAVGIGFGYQGELRLTNALRTGETFLAYLT